VSFVDFESTNLAGPSLTSFHVWLLRISTTSVKVGPKIESFREGHAFFLYASPYITCSVLRSLLRNTALMTICVCSLRMSVSWDLEPASAITSKHQSCAELGQICEMASDKNPNSR
jgi:hypothetical protein